MGFSSVLVENTDSLARPAAGREWMSWSRETLEGGM